MKRSTTRAGLGVIGMVLSGVVAVTTAPPASASPDTACMRAGIATLKGAGAFSAVAKDGLPISTAVALKVAPRAGTDLATVPDPVPLSVLLADHRAGANSLFVYPWC
ncbi:hypothetical protein [Aeromicrobium sp.]|uniref:hypothetical protein n=1 Tax=Aeromicrobium sp. TaxID=1871063 RepID=UPI002FCC109C